MADTGAAIRYERVAYLNIGTDAAPDYTLIGTGFESFDDSLNAEVDETTYISDVSATKTITAYAPEFSFEGTVIKDDDVVTFMRNIGKTLATGADAETDVVIYDVWDVDAITGIVECYKQSVVVQMDSIGGGGGGEKLTFSGTLLGKGDQVAGEFDTATLVFTEDVIS